MTCNAGLACESGTCRAPPCGDAGQACCAASTCGSGLACRDEVCRATGTLTLVAGVPTGKGFADGTGAAARFNMPTAVALDAAGNLYVADRGNSAIRKVTPAREVTTLARVGVTGTAVDATGNVFASESGGGMAALWKIAPDGSKTLLAGGGRTGTADGDGTAASFSRPQGVALDAQGNVYVADDTRIRKVTPAGVVTTFAGTTESGFVNGSASTARFGYSLRGGAIGPNGTLYVADPANYAVRMVTPLGVVSTYSTYSSFYGPQGVAVSPTGSVCVVNGNAACGAGGGSDGWADGTGSAARFRAPEGVALAASGTAYVADAGNNAIRMVAPGGVVTTFAGAGSAPGFADGPAATARFELPGAVAADRAGNVYVADSGNALLRKISPQGLVSTVAGLKGYHEVVDGTGSGARFNAPEGLAIDDAGNLYVAERLYSVIRKVTPAGTVTTIAGFPGESGSVDGTGSAARFNRPRGVAVDGSGNVYVADSGNDCIRKVTPAGVVTTIAGRAGAPGSANGVGASAQFYAPYAVAVDGAGNVYVAEYGNDDIRKITPAGLVTTLAGSGSGFADGPGTRAKFWQPVGIAVNAAGNLYVADFMNDTIRRITPDGYVSTAVGVSRGSGSTLAPSFGNMLGSLPAGIVAPRAVAVDPSTGNLLIAVDDAVLRAVLDAP